MKFGAQLKNCLTPEWRGQYVRYDELKKLLYQLANRIPSPPPDNEDAPDDSRGEAAAQWENTRARFIQRCDDWFLAECDDELRKMELFFAQKQAETLSRYGELIGDLEAFKGARLAPKYAARSRITPAAECLQPGSGGSAKSKGSLGATPSPGRKLSVVVEMAAVSAGIVKTDDHKTEDQVKLAFSEFYLGLIKLQKFQQLNATGFRKILKKHDKLFANDAGRIWFKRVFGKAAIVTSERVDGLITETEDLFIAHLEKGDRQTGMKRLRVLDADESGHGLSSRL